MSFFQKRAALDQDAAACGGSQPADDSHRRRDHQRAGAGDHQQHQRTVCPIQPAADEQRRNERDQQRHQKYRRGINFGEAVDEALRRRFGALRLFNGMDNTRQRGIGGGGRHPVFKRAAFVDGAGKHAIADGFVHRQAFAGDRRLIHRRTAAYNLAVQRDTLAGFDAHDTARLEGFRVHILPVAVRQLHCSGFRRQRHQAGDGVSGPIQRAGFNQFGDSEQHHHHGGLRPLLQQQCAGDCYTHQRIDVQVAVAYRHPAFAVGGQPTGGDGDNGQ